MIRPRQVVAAAALVLCAACGSSAAAGPAYVPPDPPRSYAALADCKVDAGVLPDSRCTPGDTNPAVIADGPAYAKTICSGGWAGAQWPTSDVTEAVKRVQLLGDASGRDRQLVARFLRVPANKLGLKVYGEYAGGTPADYEADLLVPPELGGTTRPQNWWVMPTAEQKAKEALTDQVGRWVCGAPVAERPTRVADATRMVVFNWHQLADLVKT